MNISKLAAEAGVKTDTVRYYERSGLLPKAERATSGYRVFGQADVRRLRFIRGAQRLGLRLREIRDLLDVIDKGQCPCGHTNALLQRRLAEIDSEIAELTALKLSGVAGRFSAEASPGDGGWPCERELIQIGRR